MVLVQTDLAFPKIYEVRAVGTADVLCSLPRWSLRGLLDVPRRSAGADLGGGGSDASEGGTKMGRWLTRPTYRMVKGVSQSYGTSHSHWTNELASYCAARPGCRVGEELSFATAVPARGRVKRTEFSPKKSVFKNSGR